LRRNRAPFGTSARIADLAFKVLRIRGLPYEQLIPAPPDIGSVAFGTMHRGGRTFFTASLATLVLIKHIDFEAVSTIVATEVNTLSHS
jgi:hypothetical protein